MRASPQPQIRAGRCEDLSQAIVLLNSAKLPTADLPNAHGLRTWVLEAGTSLVGVVALESFGREALVRSLVVASEYRQRGFGHQLVERLERDARADGIEQLILLTETAEKFFRGLGYEVIDRRAVSEDLRGSTEFRSLCPATAVCMRKSLMS